MNHPVVVKISNDGNATVIYHPTAQQNTAIAVSNALGHVTHERRGAYVYPRRKWKRKVFKALRRIFGERGRVADWTRQWRCRWVVVLPGEHVRLKQIFNTRNAAIKAEVAWLLEHQCATSA